MPTEEEHITFTLLQLHLYSIQRSPSEELRQSTLMHSRRLNDCIVELCVAAVAAPEGAELDCILDELRAALKTQIQRIRSNALQPGVERRQDVRFERGSP